ncbi:30S ribosomal protein S4 [Candidatus Pacearchaeota archaeon]|nr:30S ribosomal protein S4 [Candidatus Pacearchaeota archaeon]
MIRKHKKYSRPRKAFDIKRITNEDAIVAKYGLKNKKEIWKAKSKLDIIRKTAKRIIYAGEEEQAKFLEKLNKMGLTSASAVDVLALTEEDILNRRLQTIIFKKGIATTANGARQIITHKHIAIENKIVNIPSYHVSTEEENKINFIKKEKISGGKNE